MQHYKAPDNSLHCIEPEFEYLLPAGCVAITEEEAEALRAANEPQPDPKGAIREQIKQLEAEQLMPRATREFMLLFMETNFTPEVLALNPGYQAVKAFDNQIKAPTRPAMIDLLVILLKPALLWESAPWRYWYLLPVAAVAWAVDVAIAHTTWALLYGWPKHYELTISHTLERLCRNPLHPDYELLRQIALKINRVSPTGKHIKAVVAG